MVLNWLIDHLGHTNWRNVSWRTSWPAWRWKGGRWRIRPLTWGWSCANWRDECRNHRKWRNLFSKKYLYYFSARRKAMRVRFFILRSVKLRILWSLRSQSSVPFFHIEKASDSNPSDFINLLAKFRPLHLKKQIKMLCAMRIKGVREDGYG